VTITRSGDAWRPYVRLAVEEIDALWPKASIGTYTGHDPSIDRAADFMIPDWSTASGKAMGDALAAWARTNSVRLGIWYVIWRGRIWSRTRPERGWLRYFDASSSNPSRSHKNHVHISWYKTAPGVTSTGVYAMPSSNQVYLDKIRAGQMNSDTVAYLQVALGKVLGKTLTRTGDYDAATLAAAKAYQVRLGDKPEFCDGLLGPLQTLRLFADAGMTSIKVFRSSVTGGRVRPPAPEADAEPDPASGSASALPNPFPAAQPDTIH
jgi:hypothetical protein